MNLATQSYMTLQAAMVFASKVKLAPELLTRMEVRVWAGAGGQQFGYMPVNRCVKRLDGVALPMGDAAADVGEVTNITDPDAEVSVGEAHVGAAYGGEAPVGEAHVWATYSGVGPFREAHLSSTCG